MYCVGLARSKRPELHPGLQLAMLVRWHLDIPAAVPPMLLAQCWQPAAACQGLCGSMRGLGTRRPCRHACLPCAGDPGCRRRRATGGGAPPADGRHPLRPGGQARPAGRPALLTAPPAALSADPVAHVRVCVLQARRARQRRPPLLARRNGVGKSSLLKAMGWGLVIGFPKSVRCLYVDQLEGVDPGQSPVQVVVAADTEAQRAQVGGWRGGPWRGRSCREGLWRGHSRAAAPCRAAQLAACSHAHASAGLPQPLHYSITCKYTPPPGSARPTRWRLRWRAPTAPTWRARCASWRCGAPRRRWRRPPRLQSGAAASAAWRRGR